jgi:hypothetical protein
MIVQKEDYMTAENVHNPNDKDGSQSTIVTARQMAEWTISRGDAILEVHAEGQPNSAPEASVEKELAALQVLVKPGCGFTL